MASSESQKMFLDIFGDEMQKAGYIRKNNMFFKVDMQHKWIKAVFMAFWGQNRLYRICLDILPFTSIFELKRIRDRVLFEINSLVRDFVTPIASENQVLTFTPFFPTLENITRSFGLYMRYIHSELNSATTFDECIQYRSRLKKLAHLQEFDECEMMYACLYLNRFEDAHKLACLYKSRLCELEKSIQESHKRDLSAFPSIQYHEEMNRIFEIRKRNINEQLKGIDDILSSFQNHQLEPLMNEVQHRIDATIDSCHQFFTKREQKMLGM